MNRAFGWRPMVILCLPNKTCCQRFTSKSWTSKKVRQTFIDFFKENGHQFVPSSSVVPKKNDGSYFVNAGMNQFKPLFLGSVDPNSEMATYSRVVNSQKCIRVGGKHNDLDDVGHDTYHHTFFEMLGNWSFASYFKREACMMAWNLLTETYRLPKSRLYVTYFGGCSELGLEPDLESRSIWIENGVPSERVLPFSMKDNFWAMGNTGPCGPCTEIHFDLIDRPNASGLVNAGSPEVIELWNLVFMQFDRQADGFLQQLPQKHVDTGMGLERITAVLQGHASNYDTDLFAPLFGAIQKGCHCRPYSGQIDDHFDVAYRIVADHTRMLSVAIADGLLPGKRESGGKLRQIMHRCVHQASIVLGSTPGFLGDLTSVVVDILGDVYPELAKHRDQIRDVTNQTEHRYLENLVFGRQMITKALSKYGNIRTLSGEQLLEIQDGRFGKSVPADVICLLVTEFGLTADMEEFEKILQDKQGLSCAALVDDSTELLSLYDVDFLKAKDIGPTNDSFKYDHFWTGDGYGFETVEAKVVALKFDGEFVDCVAMGNTCGLLLDKTNFYAEAGGQVADRGLAVTDKGDEAQIFDVQSRQNYVLHKAIVEQGSLNVGDTVLLSLDKSRRQGCMLNHTATHLVSSCLNKVLGNVRQQSSMVSDEKLSFEFTCTKMSVSNEDLLAVTELANQLIQNGTSVYHSVLPLHVARSIENLVTLVDEVYPSSVNVVSIGIPISNLLLEGKMEKHQCCNSVELCCGTHVDNLSHLGAVVITHLQGANQSTKRLIAVTGERATQALKSSKSLRSQLEVLSKVQSTVEAMEISQNITKLLADSSVFPKVDREAAQKELEQLMLSQQVNKVKNEGKLADLSKVVADLLQENSASATFVSSFDFTKTRDIVEVLVRLAPNHSVVLISTSNLFTEVIVGVAYVPKEGKVFFTSSQLSEFLCQELRGSYSLPKGKLAKHTNFHIFSLPLKGDRNQEINRVLDLAKKFVTEAELKQSTKIIS